jgi:hypothetical protein
MANDKQKVAASDWITYQYVFDWFSIGTMGAMMVGVVVLILFVNHKLSKN